MLPRFHRHLSKLGFFCPLLTALSAAGAGFELRIQEEPATESTNPFTHCILDKQVRGLSTVVDSFRIEAGSNK